ncbi:MAG: ABC transporter substrate-binding protein [Succinivibrio sp.]|jgi:phospholipid transport system substrate-binding protein|nr:ABC transporter substrate-binding protein [Succinivibrio sp.]
MKKIFSYFLALGIALCGVSSVQAADNNPYELANEVATTTINDIKANKDKLSDRSVAEGIIEKDLIPYIDIKYAAYKVIGTSLKNTSAEERQRFTDEFAVYMKNSLIDVLSKYTNQDIVPAKVESVDPSTNLVSVKLLIREAGKKDLELVLKLRKNNKTGQWKAFDLIGENISMLDAKISELSPIIKNNGVDAAIAKLKSGDKK